MALKAVKRLVNRGMDSSLDAGLEMEMLAMIMKPVRLTSLSETGTVGPSRTN